MAKVLLIQPRIGEWDETRSHLCVPVAILAAATLVANEFETVLIDSRLPSWQKKLLRELKQNPLCAGLTSITGSQIKYSLEISKFIKAHSDVPVAWGGIQPTLLPEITLTNNNIDIIVVNEGEISFLELVRKLDKKESLHGIKGIWFKENGKIIQNESREYIDLNQLPNLPYHLIDIKHYLPLFKGRRTLYLETSRGCVGKCTFCSNIVYNKRQWRAMSPETVLERIKSVYNKYGINSFYFIDDNFFVDLKRARRIAEMIIEQSLDIIFEVQGIRYDSALQIDDDFLGLLYRSGLRKVHFGAESGSQRMLDMIGKGITVDDIINVNRRWAKYDIVVQHNFMAGFPTETIDDIKATISLIYKLKKENPHAMTSPICPYTPYPGTSLYQEALDNGFMKRKTLEDWIESDYGDSIWISSARDNLLKKIFFVTLFLESQREKDMLASPFLKIGFSIYRKIAHFRLKKFFFAFMAEMTIKNIISFFYIKMRNFSRTENG